MTQATATGRAWAAQAPLTARVRAAARRMSAGFLAVFVAALLAFTWQSFVTQTHIHPDSLPVAAHATSRAAPTQPAPERPIDCPICHAAAVSGHYLAPGPALVLAIFAIAVWRFVAAAAASSRATRSHGWRSRAPPLSRI
jgi:hypothetical protein